MTVNSIVVKQATQIAALRLFLQNSSRKAKDLETFLEDQGVPVYDGIYLNERKFVSNRAADRLLQRAKKNGIVSFSGGRWLDSYATESFLKGTSHT